jgi:hypothetical protein
MAKQTAMMDLRADLVKSIESSLQALSEINDPELRAACQNVVSIALKAVIKRIDDELLPMEREQIIDAHCDGQDITDTAGVPDAQNYFTQTYGGNNG